jgi:hypothetical protein
MMRYFVDFCCYFWQLKEQNLLYQNAYQKNKEQLVRTHVHFE